MRTALYIRVSTEEQAKHGLSLDAQRADLTAYAAAHDLTVVGLYEDDGVSARTAYRKREAFMRLLEDVQRDRIDLILFIRLDRWFRNVAGYYEIQKVLDANHVAWKTTQEDYDTTTANGRLHLNIKLSIAQDEADRTAERINFVFDQKRSRDEYIGKPPLGCRIEDKHLVVDEKTAPVVSDIFQTYIATRSIGETQRQIEIRHGMVLTYAAYKYILRNQRYTRTDPPVVPAATLKLASEIMLSRSTRNTTGKARVYPFSGILYCSHCGSKMVSRCVAGGRKMYRCRRHASARDCTFNCITDMKVERLMIQLIPKQIQALNVEIQDKNAEVIDREKVRRRMEKLKNLYLDDLIDRELYEAEYKALKEKLQDPPTPIDFDNVMSVLEVFESFSDEKKRTFWSHLIKRCYIKETEPRIDKIILVS